MLARMVLGTFFPPTNGIFPVLGGGGRGFARMVCSLFSSFLRCKKADEKKGPKKVLHSARLIEGGGQGEVGLKLFGQCPYGNNTFQKKGFPNCANIVWNRRLSPGFADPHKHCESL